MSFCVFSGIPASLAIRTSSSLLGRGKHAGKLAMEEGGARVIEEGGAGLSSVIEVGGASSNTELHVELEVCGVPRAAVR